MFLFYYVQVNRRKNTISPKKERKKKKKKKDETGSRLLDLFLISFAILISHLKFEVLFFKLLSYYMLIVFFLLLY